MMDRLVRLTPRSIFPINNMGNLVFVFQLWSKLGEKILFRLNFCWFKVENNLLNQNIVATHHGPMYFIVYD